MKRRDGLMLGLGVVLGAMGLWGYVMVLDWWEGRRGVDAWRWGG